MRLLSNFFFIVSIICTGALLIMVFILALWNVSIIGFIPFETIVIMSNIGLVCSFVILVSMLASVYIDRIYLENT